MLAACHGDVRSSAAAAPSSSPPASIADVDVDDGEGPLRWRLRATLPEDHREVSWLETTAEGLVISASTEALTRNGAAVFRLSDAGLTTLFESEGQGFLRVHAWGRKLLVPDADAAFGVGFFLRLDVDGAVFVLDADGSVHEEVLRAVYHVFDVVELDGRLYASTGAYVPGDVPYRSDRAPAALFVQGPPGDPWQRIVEFPARDAQADAGVMRFTYLFALHAGVLLAGVSDWNAGSHAVRIEGLPDAPRIVRIPELTGQTRQWGGAGAKVYHLSEDTLSVSTDHGHTFEPLATPEDPQGFAVVDGSLLVLSNGALHRSENDTSFTEVVPAHPSLVLDASGLHGVAMRVHGGNLWAASPRTGEIFELGPGAIR